MALIALPVANKQKAVDLCNAFIAGAPKSAEGYVLYGVKDDNYAAWCKAKASGKDWWWIDGSYFDCARNQQFRITKNAIQVQNARGLQSDGKRFANLGLELKPQQYNPEGHWVFVEQSEVFMRLTAGDPKWLANHLHVLPATASFRIRHWGRDKMKLQTTLHEDLVGARMLVTHTSAAAVTAALVGVPVAVSPMHALHGMLADDRRHYMEVLADNQWSVPEMREGVAWRWLNR